MNPNIAAPKPNAAEHDEADSSPPHRCPFWVQYTLISPLRRILEPAVGLLAPHVTRGMTVVEPGCGFGYFSLPLARLVGPEGKLISLDVEPRAIARLEKRARRAGLGDRITTRVCDARDMGLGEFTGRVDLVVVLHALHEIDALDAFAAQVRSLLRPDGRLLVVEPKGHVAPEKLGAMIETCKQAGLVEVDRPDVGRRRLAALFEAAHMPNAPRARD